MFFFSQVVSPLVSDARWRDLQIVQMRQQHVISNSIIGHGPGGWWTTSTGPVGPWKTREEAQQRGQPMGPFASRALARQARQGH